MLPRGTPCSGLLASVHMACLGPSQKPHAIFGSKSVTRMSFWGHSKVMQSLHADSEKILTPLWLLQWVVGP